MSNECRSVTWFWLFYVGLVYGTFDLLSLCEVVIKPKKYKKYQRAGNARHYALPFKRLYSLLKKNAKARGIKVTLPYESYVAIAESCLNCDYCMAPLKWVRHGLKATSINLDRIDNSKGYSEDNVVASCGRCNNARGRGFTYREWRQMTAMFREGTAE